jgi:hypothetical protein
LLLQPGQPQPVRDQLIISAPGQEFALLLQAEVMVPPSNVEVTAAANLSGGGLVGNGGAGSSGGADTMAGFAGGATSLPGAGSGTSAAPGPGGKDYRELFGRKPAGPAGLSTLVSSPLPSARGQNGEIALPPMVSLDGLIASSPYKLKTDVTLPTVPVFRVHHTTASRALLVWQRPKDFQANYEVEVRGLAFNPSTQQEECVWIPASNVKLTVADAYVTAEVRGLRADSYYIFRVFVVGPNGTNSLPSRESGARTMPATISLATLINLGFAVLALAGGAGFYFHFRREALG